MIVSSFQRDHVPQIWLHIILHDSSSICFMPVWLPGFDTSKFTAARASCDRVDHGRFEACCVPPQKTTAAEVHFSFWKYLLTAI